MKKFGTPIGAGPGSDKENVGFEVLGTPLPVGSLDLCEVLVVFFFALLLLLLLLLGLGLGLALVGGVWPWLEDCSGDEEVGCGVVLDELVVVVFLVPGALECEGEVEVELDVVVDDDDELEDEDEDEDEDELDGLGSTVVVVVVVVDVVEDEEELDGLGSTVVVVVVVVVDDDAVAGVVQIIVSETVPGIPRVGIIPGVASIGTVFTVPPTSVTATVHGSAEAIGMAPRPRTTEIEAARSSTARSLRLNVKLVRPLLPPSTCASHASKFAAHRCEGTVLTGTEVCNFEPAGSRRRHTFIRARARARTAQSPQGRR